jgi:hypothetical protein
MDLSRNVVLPQDILRELEMLVVVFHEQDLQLVTHRSANLSEKP